MEEEVVDELGQQSHAPVAQHILVLSLLDHVGDVGGDEEDEFIQELLGLDDGLELRNEDEQALPHGHLIDLILLDELELA